MDELVAKAKNGDKEAFSKLVVFVKSDLYKMAKARISNEEDINDIIQNTLFIAYQNINKLHYDKYFKTWIIRILINECNKFYKEQKRSQNIIDRYTNNHDFEEYDFDESDINIDDIKKLLTDKEKEMFNLYYVEHLTIKQIAKIMNINENTVKSRLKTGRDRIKSKYSRIVLMILIVFVVATGVVFGKDIINYILSLFNLQSIGYNNDSILDAIADREWVQNVDMDYIELNDEYSIKVDYLLFDDINLYMIFDLKSKSGFGENNRFSIGNLKIEDEDGNVLVDKAQWGASQVALITGWKNISSTQNNIRELTYIINEYSNMNKLKVIFNNIVIYNSENYNTYVLDNNKINVNNVSFEIKLDDKFINKSSKRYKIEDKEENISFEIERALYSDTGFYAIIKTHENNINLLLKDTNNKIYPYFKLLLNVTDENDYFYYLITANIAQEYSNLIILQNKKNSSGFINLKIE